MYIVVRRYSYNMLWSPVFSILILYSPKTKQLLGVWEDETGKSEVSTQLTQVREWSLKPGHKTLKQHWERTHRPQHPKAWVASLAPPVYVLPLNLFSLQYSVWNSLIRICLLRQDHLRPTSEQRAFQRAITLSAEAWFILLCKVLYVGYGQPSPRACRWASASSPAAHNIF